MSNIFKWVLFTILGFGIMAAISYSIYVSFSLKDMPDSVKQTDVPTTLDIKSGISNTLANIVKLPKSTNGFKTYKSSEPGKSTYTLTGAYSRTDTVNSLIFIKDNSGSEYSFKIEKSLYKDSQYWLQVYIVPDMETLSVGVPINPLSTPPPSTKNMLTSVLRVNLSEIPPTSLDKIVVRWSDTRSLSQIKAQYKESVVTPLNVNSFDNTILAVVK